MDKNSYREGDSVIIYTDPMTEKHIEGAATIKRLIARDEVFTYVAVIFDSEELSYTCLRKILNKDAT